MHIFALEKACLPNHRKRTRKASNRNQENRVCVGTDRDKSSSEEMLQGRHRSQGERGTGGIRVGKYEIARRKWV
jgi:hypothetical protein